MAKVKKQEHQELRRLIDVITNREKYNVNFEINEIDFINEQLYEYDYNIVEYSVLSTLKNMLKNNKIIFNPYCKAIINKLKKDSNSNQSEISNIITIVKNEFNIDNKEINKLVIVINDLSKFYKIDSIQKFIINNDFNTFENLMMNLRKVLTKAKEN